MNDQIINMSKQISTSNLSNLDGKNFGGLISSPEKIAAMLFFSLIGGVLFFYARKNKQYPLMLSAASLMFFTYLFTQPANIVVVGFCLIILPFVFKQMTSR